MPILPLPEHDCHFRETGDPDGRAVVFAHALGLDQRMWDGVINRLPDGLRLVTMDMRGHGQSTVPKPPYTMGALVRDAEAICDHLRITDCVFVGISIGGMIAQGLAAKRLDIVRGLVLSNTAAKIGTREIWDRRIAEVDAKGMDAIVAPTLERWFARRFRGGPEALAMAERLRISMPQGYAGCAAAIAGTDFYTTTAALRLPALVVAGGHDGSTPPDLVRETADLIPGSRFELMRGSGHLPPIDDPDGFAELLTDFLHQIGHCA